MPLLKKSSSLTGTHTQYDGCNVEQTLVGL